MGEQKIEITKDASGNVMLFASMYTKIDAREATRWVNAMWEAIDVAEHWQESTRSALRPVKHMVPKKEPEENAVTNTDRGEPSIEHLRDMRKPRGRPPKNPDEERQEAAGV